MKRYYKTLTAMTLAVVLALSSCKDFLSVDQYFTDELRLDSVFLSPRYLEAYMWGAAARFPDEGRFFYGSIYTPGPFATDEAFTLHSNTPGMNFVLGNIAADNLGTLNQWGDMYKIIRKCNNIFANIDGVPNLLPKDKTRLIAYTHFIRAYAYYHLLMNYGPPILLGDEVVDVNKELVAYDKARATYDEAVEYICKELETAATGLPYTQPIPEFGKPTKGAAYGLVARLRLIHASPLYNGGNAASEYFGNWVRKTDGVHYISQTYDEKRWAIAAAAARRVMQLSAAGQPMYDLYIVKADAITPPLPAQPSGSVDPDYTNPWPAGATGIDPYRSYAEVFNGEAPMTTNPEYVWARTSAATLDQSSAAFPYSIGGTNGLGLTQKVVDAFLMNNGQSINDAMVDGYYSEDGITAQMKYFSGYRQNIGISSMYDNREMRFYASIGFSECFWPCTSALGSQGTNVTVSYYVDSPDGKTGPTDPSNYPITGYVLKKYIHPQDSWLASASGSKRTEKVFGIIRYAEILLAYAEAINNLEGSYTLEEKEMPGLSDRTFTRDIAEIKNSFNKVRYRAGLPGLTTTQLGEREEVQRQIERERMVELLCENHRYFDVRRWGKYESSETEPILGMNTEGAKSFYSMRISPPSSRVLQRRVDRRMVFLPLPRSEIKRLPACDQNPGWE